ncbi:MAG: hypothetical protein ACLFS9_03950 [Nitriliruptoraceae bacterium]
MQSDIRHSRMSMDQVSPLSSRISTACGAGLPSRTMVAALAAELPVPVIAEGRYRTAEQVRAALAAGAWAVVVGTAITRPQIITRTLIDAVRATSTPPDQEPQ